ncbi:hypothetical protein Krad_4557 (plasmid) [Kineococcus radiotolerans SRS30216 = ATCC BAA-149]|uniref:Uncharacterized protein n=1 Tax=Kineococcus radiotolerans (strain ATCC BAA-149 / DSM 14245 / SRS30216) TaxID=266940 RepID=A6WGS7_KINRD|nr:hypothetical protein Krad_4557 [Kineococcus radiotolerans SRS30216 = ATCC BAA-149]
MWHQESVEVACAPDCPRDLSILKSGLAQSLNMRVVTRMTKSDVFRLVLEASTDSSQVAGGGLDPAGET